MSTRGCRLRCSSTRPCWGGACPSLRWRHRLSKGGGRDFRRWWESSSVLFLGKRGHQKIPKIFHLSQTILADLWGFDQHYSFNQIFIFLLVFFILENNKIFQLCVLFFSYHISIFCIWRNSILYMYFFAWNIILYTRSTF